MALLAGAMCAEVEAERCASDCDDWGQDRRRQILSLTAGQKAERGLATTQAILGYVGRKLKPCAGYETRYGWQDLHLQKYPGIGSRLMANCDVPDLDLLPQKWARSFAEQEGTPVIPHTGQAGAGRVGRHSISGSHDDAVIVRDNSEPCVGARVSPDKTIKEEIDV